MKTQDNKPYIYHLSENVSDFLFEYLNDTTLLNKEEWTYENQKITNPKITFFEQRVAALEGGVAALAVKSFNKAKYSVIKSLLRAGENIVTFNSYSLFTKDKERLSRAGIEVKFSSDGNLNTFEKLIDENTKLIYLETISPELLSIPDFQKIKFIARAWNIPVLVDNSAGAAGYITRPLKNGANILIEKTTHWLPSHKGLIGAVIVDGGNYDWFNGKFPQLNNKIHFLQLGTSSNKNTKAELAFSLINFFKKEGNINLTSDSIPEDPFSLIYDFDHLNTIIQRQSDNARKLAVYLRGNEEIETVNYTGIPGNPSYFKATTFFRNGFGPYIKFTFKDSVKFDRFKEYSINSLFKDKISFGENQIYLTVPTNSYSEIEEAFELFFNYAKIPTVKKFKELNSLEAIL